MALRDGERRVDVIDPGRRLEKRGHDQRQPRGPQPPFRQTAPRPVLRPPDEVRAERVTFDVPAGSHQDVHCVDRSGLEAALVDGTFANGVAATTPANGVGHTYPMNQPRELSRVRGAQDQMPVRGHHAVGDQSGRIAIQPVPEDCQKCTVVARAREERMLVGTAVYHVKERCSDARTGPSCHRGASSHSKADAGFQAGGRPVPIWG